MLYRRLGKGITDKFLRPYNEKLYATDLDRLDVDAMGRFFPHADIADIIANMRPRRRRDAGYNATFTYPAGGAVQYIHALLRDLPAGTVRVRRAGRSRSISRRATVTTPRRTIAFDARGVSSAPLPALARLCGVAARSGGVLVEQGAGVQPRLRSQGPARRPLDVLPRPLASSFYRVGWYDNILDADRMSLYVEIGAPHGAAFDVDALRARVLDDLRREAIVTDHQLVAHHHVVLDPAYVHITQASLAETARLKAALAAPRRPLGRPLRRLDLLLDRGQPGRDPGARGVAGVTRRARGPPVSP